MPTLEWGPEEHALIFPAQSEATRIAARLSAKHASAVVTKANLVIA